MAAAQRGQRPAGARWVSRGSSRSANGPPRAGWMWAGTGGGPPCRPSPARHDGRLDTTASSAWPGTGPLTLTPPPPPHPLPPPAHSSPPTRVPSLSPPFVSHPTLCLRPNRLGGLVVKASASGAEDPGFESRLRRDFFRGRVIPVTSKLPLQ